MKRRCCVVFLLAIVAGTSGCAGTARREDGSPLLGPRAWNEPPAPPQRPVAMPASRTEKVAEPAAQPEGLARYFPGLRRNKADATGLAAKSQPTWFSPRASKAVGTQTYMTDAREQLSRPGPEPTALPVALQVPTERASSDNLVTPTRAEATEGRRPGPSVDPTVTQSSSEVPDFGGKPPRPGEDEVNPLPPASEAKDPAAAVARMPEVPPVDPLAPPRSEKEGSTRDPGDEDAPDDRAVKATDSSAEPASPPAAEPAKPSKPTDQVAETSKTAPAPAPTPVMASPQGPPPKHAHQVAPTSQARPTPQAGAATAGEAKTWKRPCLRRLVRKVCNLGEYASPPTAAPH